MTGKILTIAHGGQPIPHCGKVGVVMDPVTLAYYAIVCGILGATAPRIPSLVARFVIGVVVGLLAAGVLPWIKVALSGG